MPQNQSSISTYGFLRLPQVLEIFQSAKARGGKVAARGGSPNP